ncbi:MAG: DUF1836 domain-containing protein [Firmicutes bacterium]|nr:DUF1836 domain-containing protein [Bacillota bacterium]
MMQYDEALVAGKLRRWEKYLDNYRLPQWEEIPELGLYMEQVIVQLKKYLDYMPPELKEEQFITAATINNYVRMRVMPGPEKKRYYRKHIAYLIIICSLKQGMSLALVQKIIPMNIPEEEVERIYSTFIKLHAHAIQYFKDQVRLAAGTILGHEDAPEWSLSSPQDLIVETAVVGTFSRLLSEKLLLLEGHTLEDGGSIEIVDKKR